MRKIIIYTAIILLLPVIFISWTNKNTGVCDPTDECVITGLFTGESKSTKGQTAQMTYDLRDNNLAVGMSSPTGSAVTFGGYKTTCDSIYISVCYTGNMSYYLLKGKFSDDHTTITGTFQNKVTSSDKGTFTISKL